MWRHTLTLLVLSALTATGAWGSARNVESLKGVEAFEVVVVYEPRPGTAPYLEPTQQGSLRASVEARLRDEGLPVREVGSPRLRVRIESGGDDHGTVMYGVKLDFMQRPESGDGPLRETWQLESWGFADNREMQSVVERDLDAALGELIRDWLSVNPRASRHPSER